MRRYAFLILLICGFSTAHASLTTEADVDLKPEEVSAFIRVSPEANVEKSEFFEVAPEESMEEITLEQMDQYASSESDAVSKKTSGKQVRCMDDSGGASFYWQSQAVASGGQFNPNAMTAAHRKLPFGTQVKVTNLKNGKSVIVTINDRGPFTGGRIIDLSRASFGKIAPYGQGVARVKMEIVSCGG